METKLQSALGSYLKDNPGSERILADDLQVAVPTINRWKNGTARPGPRLTQVIIDHLQNKTKRG
ncbi:MAG: hypothetical protein V4690_03345 [Patescibacteria group bacterium]